MSENATTPATQPNSDPALAEHITGLLKGALQANRISHIFVGQLLAQVRDEKMYAALGYADLATYARERLQLGKTSLGNYLRVYDWVKANHPQWLDPDNTTFIPDLYDIADLIRIEKDLQNTTLSPKTRAGLEDLKDKALSGELKAKDRSDFHKRGRTADGRKAFLTRMQMLRASGNRLHNLPSAILPGLDELIAILRDALTTTDSISEATDASSKL